MDLDHVDVVARGIQQDVAPVIGNRPGVRPPVDEAGTEVEVWLQQVVLADVNVLTSDHLDDLVLCVEITTTMHPTGPERSTLAGGSTPGTMGASGSRKN